MAAVSKLEKEIDSMKSVRIMIITVIFSFVLFYQPSTTCAGPYTDDLTKCMIESTTMDDRIQIIKWIFLSISVHPAVKNFSSVSEDQINDSNKIYAALIIKLLTESCKEKAEKAIRYEGDLAIKTSLQILSQVAAQDLFTNKDVAAVAKNFEKYFDIEKVKSLLSIK